MFASEGSIKPSKTEINWARVCNFNFYTVTNLAVVDLAYHLGLKVQMFAACRKDLRHHMKDEASPNFAEIHDLMLPSLSEAV